MEKIRTYFDIIGVNNGEVGGNHPKGREGEGVLDSKIFHTKGTRGK